MINVQIDEEKKEVAIELIHEDATLFYFDNGVPGIKIPLTTKNLVAIKESLSNEIACLERYMRDKYRKNIIEVELAERSTKQ